MDCLFCKIAQKTIPSEIVWEGENFLAFKDIHPLAPIHVLLIPKKHIESINDLTEADSELMGKLILTAKKIAVDFDISPKGYKLLFRVGEWGGQEVPHIHLHLIGGVRLFENIRPWTNIKE